jgi:hypothetical protein
MKKVLKIKSMIIAGSVAGLCLVGSAALANPSMVPDHPGYPMNASKSPVSNVPTANDPGQEAIFGQKALNAATRADNQDQKIHSRAGLEGNQSDEKVQNGQSQQSEMTGHEVMPGQEHMTNQNQNQNSNKTE